MDGYFARRTYRPQTTQTAAFAAAFVIAAVSWGCFIVYRVMYEAQPISSRLLPECAGVIFFTFIGIMGFISSMRSRRDLLIVDEHGVTVRRRGYGATIRWGEIQKARKFGNKYDEDNREVVAIQRKGELTYGPTENSLDGFDADADELLAAIRHGQMIFGD